MKEIIEVISKAFNRGYEVAKQEIPGDGMASWHNMHWALKEEIESATKVLKSINKPVEQTVSSEHGCKFCSHLAVCVCDD